MLDGSFGAGLGEERNEDEEDYERKPKMKCSLLVFMGRSLWKKLYSGGRRED